MPADDALPPGMETVLDRLIAPAEARNPGKSAFRLVSEGTEAFVVRARSACQSRVAAWTCRPTSGTTTPRVDSLLSPPAGGRPRRKGTPAGGRHGRAWQALQFSPPSTRIRTSRCACSTRSSRAPASCASSPKRLETSSASTAACTTRAGSRTTGIRRLVGGRNLGDEYFGASEEVNFVDLDFAMVGPSCVMCRSPSTGTGTLAPPIRWPCWHRKT